MIILGVVLLIVEWLLGDLGVDVPLVLLKLLHDGGIILIILGIVLLVLSFLGRPLGGGWGPTVGGRRYWW